MESTGKYWIPIFKVSAEYVGKEVHLILDNARYQKCSAVQELAVGLGIHLEYIPPYSPNLNLIERLWKFVIRSKYYDDFALFKEKIDSIIKSTTDENKSKVDSLVGEKVQLYDNLRQITENTFKQIRGNKAA